MRAGQLQALDKLFTDFSRETGTSISFQAKVVVKELIEAITSDPHRSWKNQEDEVYLAWLQWNTIEQLGEHLKALRKGEKAQIGITTFDILHWLSRNLEGICPGEK